MPQSRNRKDFVQVVIRTRTMQVDASDCTFIIKKVPDDMHGELVEKLQGIQGFENVRVEDDAIIVGMDEMELFRAHQDEEHRGGDEDAFPGYCQISRAISEVCPDYAIRKRMTHPDRGKSMASLIWGEDWEDEVALTAEERSFLT